MKRMKKLSVTLLAFLLIACTLLTMAGCPGESGTDLGTTGATETTAPQGSVGGDGKINYTVQVKTLGGMALKDVKVYIYKGTGDDEAILGYASTDEKGFATINAKPAADCRVVLSGVPQGYNVNPAGYPMTDNSMTVVLTSSVITDGTKQPSVSGLTYKLGDVMRDFTVTSYDGEKTVKLSEVLAEKKMVLLNFWYDGCQYCLEEFPALNEVYEQFEDQVEVVALSPYDDNAAIADFLKNYAASLPEGGLTFPLAYDNANVVSSFELQGFPTSIVIDRYGVICMLVSGAMTKNEFTTVFNRFTGDNYVQEVIKDPSALTPVVKPDVQMPTSEELAAAADIANGVNIQFYAETDETRAEYSWPFVVGSKDGQTGASCIKTSNAFKPYSYATLYADVEMKAGDVLAFDWFASTELGSDVMAVIVDNKEIYSLSGVSEDWQTCYPYVALEDGTYQLCFFFYKDTSDDVGEDTVYIDNLRIVKEADIDTPTYIIRNAATGLKEDASGYDHYVEVFYNETDGYYHVDSINGPLLLANLMGYTQFSQETSVYLMAYNGKVVDADGVNYASELETYANYSINGKMYGLCPVNQGLKRLLEKVAECVGVEKDEPRQWLQICQYYHAYGTDGKQLEDPIKGLAPFSALEAELSTEGNKVENEITYTHVLMPRGYRCLFKPTVSGAYRIVSDSELPVDAWIFTATGDRFDDSAFLVYENVQRDYYDDVNCNMVVYFEAGKEYYISIGFWDVTAAGSLTFTVEFLGEEYEYFRLASPGPFTYEENYNGTTGATIIRGIDVVLVDGYYYEKRADGSIGDLIYADFVQSTPLFENSIEQIIALGGFNFTMTENDHEIAYYIEKYPTNYEEKLKEYWGEDLYELYENEVKDVAAGRYHGRGEDLTAEISAYMDKMESFAEGEAGSERNGCVAVDERLAELLQMVMDKYTFAGVENSWLKFCYYYDHMGA